MRPQEITANKAGGQAWPALFLPIAPDCKARDTTAVVRVTDLSPQYFQGTDVDDPLLDVDFTNAQGWEVEQRGDWEVAPPSANSHPKSGASTSLRPASERLVREL